MELPAGLVKKEAKEFRERYLSERQKGEEMKQEFSFNPRAGMEV